MDCPENVQQLKADLTGIWPKEKLDKLIKNIPKNTTDNRCLSHDALPKYLNNPQVKKALNIPKLVKKMVSMRQFEKLEIHGRSVNLSKKSGQSWH